MNEVSKILHLYWDRSPMSWLQTLTVITFHRFNPDWEIRLYLPVRRDADNSMFVPTYTGKDFFPMLQDLDYVTFLSIEDFTPETYYLPGILRSDILRYKVLRDSGGVWSDFDVLWIRPFSDLFRLYPGDWKSMICRYDSKHKHHNIGVLFSVPNHSMYCDLYDRCLELMIDYRKRITHQMFGVELWNEMFTDEAISYYENVLSVPYQTFYPYSVFNLVSLFNHNYPVNRDRSIGIHWFAGHKIAKSYMNSSYNRGRNCTINQILNILGL
jgi:hypothetical protein